MFMFLMTIWSWRFGLMMTMVGIVIDDGEFQLSSFIGLRNEILRGDERPLYLGWLCGLTHDYDLDERLDDPELPVPDNLGNLSASQQALVELMGIDEDLLAVAAEKSKTRSNKTDTAVEKGLEQLSVAEKDRFLRRVVSG